MIWQFDNFFFFLNGQALFEIWSTVAVQYIVNQLSYIF